MLNQNKEYMNINIIMRSLSQPSLNSKQNKALQSIKPIFGTMPKSNSTFLVVRHRPYRKQLAPGGGKINSLVFTSAEKTKKAAKIGLNKKL